MNSTDREELIRLAKENIKLQRLVHRHENYKEEIRQIRKRGRLTTSEEQEVQTLKLKKLRAKEEMLGVMKEVRYEEARKSSQSSVSPMMFEEAAVL